MRKIDSIATQIAQQIASGQVGPGQRLASVRGGAEAFGVSKNTMAEVYDRLVARGLLSARQGSGFYVTDARPAPRPPAPSPELAEASDIAAHLREQLDQRYELRPGDGRLPASWMAGDEMRRFLRAARGGEVEYGYGSPWGFAPLRERLRLALAERSIAVAPDGVLLTSGVNHALDLIVRDLVGPGDVVFVDSPGYYPLFAKLRLARARVAPIRRLADGPDLDDLAAKLKTCRPKIFFTQSQAHNPTGGGLSPSTAFRLLQFAGAHDFLIVEDDIFADLLAPSLPRLAALAPEGRVLTVGSFSKTLSASLRCGYVAGGAEMVRRLANLKMITTLATSAHVERLVMELMDSGQYLRHLRRLRARIEDSARAARDMLTGAGFAVAPQRAPGFYLWATLPEGMDERAFCRRAAAENIFIAPSSVFRPDQQPAQPPAMRVNIAYGADPRFGEFLRRAAAGAPG